MKKRYVLFTLVGILCAGVIVYLVTPNLSVVEWGLNLLYLGDQEKGIFEELVSEYEDQGHYVTQIIGNSNLLKDEQSGQIVFGTLHATIHNPTLGDADIIRDLMQLDEAADGRQQDIDSLSSF